VGGFVRLPVPHHEERIVGHALRRARQRQIARRLVEALLTHRVGPPMHAHAALDTQLAMDAHCLIGADVRIAVPHRLVRADADGRQIKTAKARGDVADVLRIAQVTREEERKARARDGKSAPQRRVTIPQRARRPVMHGQQVELESPIDGLFPPVELDNARALAARHVFREPDVHAQRRHQQRRPARLPVQRAQRGFRQVIVMRVTEQDDIDARQVGQRHAGRLMAPGTGERQRRRTVVEHRVGQDIHTGSAQEQERRVPDPGERYLAAVGMHESQVGRHGRDRRKRRAHRLVLGPVPDPRRPAVEEPTLGPLVRRVGRIIVRKAFQPVMGFGGIVIGIAVCAASCKERARNDGNRQQGGDGSKHAARPGWSKMPV